MEDDFDEREADVELAVTPRKRLKKLSSFGRSHAPAVVLGRSSSDHGPGGKGSHREEAEPEVLESPKSGLDSPQSQTSEESVLLKERSQLTGVHARDTWRGKILQAIRNFVDDDGGDDIWPGRAIAAAVGLEAAAFESLGTHLHKYNVKLRSMLLNLRKNAVLVRRLVAGELDPHQVLNFDPHELKEGKSAAEMPETPEPAAEPAQVVEAKCRLCGHLWANVQDIRSAGLKGDRYQVECQKCGAEWFASQNVVAPLRAEDQELLPPVVGLNPLATEKFSDAERQLSEAHREDTTGGGAGQTEARAEEEGGVEAPVGGDVGQNERQVEEGVKDPTGGRTGQTEKAEEGGDATRQPAEALGDADASERTGKGAVGEGANGNARADNVPDPGTGDSNAPGGRGGLEGRPGGGPEEAGLATTERVSEAKEGGK